MCQKNKQMKTCFFIFYSLCLILSTTYRSSAQDGANPFWHGTQTFRQQKLGLGFIIAVAPDGTLLAKDKFSNDGGETWKKMKSPPNADYFIINENTNEVLAQGGSRKPTPPIAQFRSKDNGISWIKEIISRIPDKNGWLPSLSACEPGITLKYGKHKGRLLMASRVFVGYDNEGRFDEHYSNAVYSDDNGKTWHSSEPFPFTGTGEAGLVELKDGTIYYNSRTHTRMTNRLTAMSYDGGKTWTNGRIDDYLPDGPPARYGCKGGLIRLPLDEYDILIFSMNDVPENKDTTRHTTKGRENLTVWASFDGGKTWPVKRLAHKTGGYSGLAAGRKDTPSEGYIFLTCDDGYFSKFNLDWITQGKSWKDFLPTTN